jgi:subtilisin-like proprotein convertase family protein
VLLTTSAGRALAMLLALALVVSACTGGGEDAAEETPDEQPGQTEDGGDGGGGDEAAAGGGGAAEEAARTWVADTYGEDVLEALEVAEVTTSPGVEHVRFAQTADDIEILEAGITVHVLESGEVQSATDDLVTAQPSEAAQEVDEAQALDVATKAVTGTVDGEPQVAQVWVRNGEVLQRAWRVEVATTDPVSSWTVLVDAASAEVLSAEEATFGLHRPEPPSAPGAAARAAVEVAQASGDACDAPSPGACVFLPDPIYAAGGSLSSPEAANDFLTPVELQGLDDASALVGEHVDTEPEGVPVEPTRQDDGTWAGGRATPGFEAAMVYYWIDRVQRQIQAAGFTDVLNGPFPVYPVDPETVDNAFYSPSEGRIHMGVGSDGINEGEDASGIVHEYGHAVLDAQAPGLLGGAEGGAYHESFGDLLAMLTTLSHRDGDVGCLFPWPEEGQCLRRLDSDKVYPDDLVQEVHLDGEIYNGAIYDVTEALLDAQGVSIEDCGGTQDCEEVADRVLATLLTANSYLTNDPTLPDVAETFVLANDAVFDGADAELIAEAFAAHGLVGGGEGMVDAGGEEMADGDGGGVVVQVDITHSYRGDLRVLAGVLGPDGEDLCEPVELAAPDEQDDGDNLIGQLDVTGTACAGFVPPSPEQVWYLQAIDTLAEDEGEIAGFNVVVEGVPYLATGVPQPIADADPEGTFAFVAGAGEDVEPDGMGEVTGDGPVLSLEISHGYRGDLDVSAGVVDADSQIICSVTVHEPDAGDSSGEGLAGDVDMSDCAELYPPSPDQRWFLLAVDTAAADEGAVEALSLTGPDGQTFAFDGVPVAIPDADPDGVALLLDGSGGSSGQAGGGGATDDPILSVSLTHPYRGDLVVTAGALSGEEVLCEVVLAAQDQEASEADLAIDASLGECARFYPPTPDRPWFVFAADTLEADEGTLDSAVLTGPDGATFAAAGLPVELPDADPEGVLVTLEPTGGGEGGGDGGGTTGGAAGEVSAEVAVTHTFVGDLEVNLGVTDADGAVLCETAVLAADPENSTADLSGSASFGECSALWPPAPDRIFYLEVIDSAAADTGSVDSFTVTGPDGTTLAAEGLPLPIPDADEAGVVIAILG